MEITRFLCASFVILLLSGCASKPIHRDPATFVFPAWTPALQANEPYAFPYVSKFWNLDESLVYVAANHRYDTEDSTFKTVKAVFETYPVRVLVIEGFVSSLGLNPGSVLSRVNECRETNYKTCGENHYAVRWAVERGIPVMPAEPTDMDIFNGLKVHGVSPDDLVYFYLVRQIPQWRAQKLIDQSFKQKAEEFMDHYYEVIGMPKRSSFAAFEKWFRAKNLTGRKLLDFDYTDVEPPRHLPATDFQKLSAEILDIREKHIVQITLQMLKEYKHVLVVYGGMHLPRQRPFWQNYFTHSKSEKIH